MPRIFSSRQHDGRTHVSNWCLWRWFDIWKDGQIYLTRLTLFRTPWFQVMVHWINEPDKDDGMHDHPWWFLAFLVQGSYHEVVGEPFRTRGEAWLRRFRARHVRFVNWKNNRTAHKITRLVGKVITLVVTGTRRKSWGFYREDQNRTWTCGCVPVSYTPWREYLDRRSKEQHS